jgi:hypothetical protein
MMEMSQDCEPGYRCKDCGEFWVPGATSRIKGRGMTEEEIEAGRSPKGGWTAATLRQWGVPWPPPKGWRKALMRGEDMTKRGGDKTADDLLREVVLAIVNAGQGHLLQDLHDVHDYFGARWPSAEEVAQAKALLRSDPDPDAPWN